MIIPAYIGQMTGGSLVNEETYELNFTQEQMEDAFGLVLELYNTNTLEPFGAVSYTHLDVYKRQGYYSAKTGQIQPESYSGQQEREEQ